MKLTVNYYVADVRFPVISVGTLTSSGFLVTMGPKESSISQDGKTCPLHKIGELFFLRNFGLVDASVSAPITSEIVSPVTAKEEIGQSSGRKDFWKFDGKTLIRVHRLPRRTMFCPTGTSDRPVGVNDLQSHRVTFVHFRDGAKRTYHTTDWSNPQDSRGDLGQRWIGESHFFVKKSQVSELSSQAPSLQKNQKSEQSNPQDEPIPGGTSSKEGIFRRSGCKDCSGRGSTS
jgi:hypothetical protein